MPLVDSNSAAVWASLYRFPARASRVNADQTVEYFDVGPNGELIAGAPQVRSYDRAAMQQVYGSDGDKLRTALNLQTTQRICLIGCGYGWLVEQWRAAGFTNVIGTEVSTYLRGRFASEVPSDIQSVILNEDGSTNTSRRSIKQALGVTGNNKLDWIITEDLLPYLSDSEVSQYVSIPRDLATNVAHWVLCRGGDSRLNWKTAAQWKALVTPDLVVERGTAVAI